MKKVTPNHEDFSPIFSGENNNDTSLNLSNAEPVSIPRRFCLFFVRYCLCQYSRGRVQSEDTIQLLPRSNSSKKTLILDLDETLVHSSLQPLAKYDLKLSVDLNQNFIDIYVLIRPGAQEFLEKVGDLYEVVIFTASLKSYADPVIDYLDRSQKVTSRLFRDDCTRYNGSYIKNLSQLGRDLKKVVIVDNSPTSYSLHPYNAIAINSWFDDENDDKLQETLQVLQVLESVDDVTELIKNFVNQSLEESPKNFAALTNNFLLGRSAVNSPTNANATNFKFPKA